MFLDLRREKEKKTDRQIERQREIETERWKDGKIETSF